MLENGPALPGMPGWERLQLLSINYDTGEADKQRRQTNKQNR